MVAMILFVSSESAAALTTSECGGNVAASNGGIRSPEGKVLTMLGSIQKFGHQGTAPERSAGPLPMSITMLVLLPSGILARDGMFLNLWQRPLVDFQLLWRAPPHYTNTFMVMKNRDLDPFSF